MSSCKQTLVLALIGLSVSIADVSQQAVHAEGVYTSTTPSRDGIGKRYFGREIARVMDHRGAAWLERKTRVSEELPNEVIRAMDLQANSVVADIGAGTGYFTIRIAPLVPAGRVYAVDIQPKMLEILRRRIQHRSFSNVTPVLGKVNDPLLPDKVIDAVLLVDAYHEFAYPYEMMSGIVRSLRLKGRVYIVEYRGEDSIIPIKPLHKMTQQQVKTELGAVGLRWVETRDFLPTQHFMVFEKIVE